MSEEERKKFKDHLDIVLSHLAIILHYVDECSDIDYFDADFEGAWSNEVRIVAHFKDDGKKTIVADADMFEIVHEILSCITGPRTYELDREDIADTLKDLGDIYKHQLNDKEKAAINSAIKLITDPNYLKEDY